jgi:manganese transport protein
MKTMLDEQDKSLSEVHASIDTTRSVGKPWWKRIFAYLGPAYLVSVGYMDPGNWATDLAGGSKFGYTLIWVLLMSNLMALLLQSLSARLGIVRGRDLAQANREEYPKYVNFVLYILAEIAIAATDLAEVLGMAIGLHLLTGIPLTWGVIITVLDTLLLLFLQRLGMRKMEIFILAMVAIVGMAFFAEIMLAKPNFAEVATGFIPHIPNQQALYIAIGIIGATVMPHNLYLHSALVQTRKIRKDDKSIRHALKMSVVDSSIALNLAFFVNAAILILAATVFYKTGRTDVARIQEAHQLLSPLLGSDLASKLFAIALIAAGQSSTITGTLSGQIVMEGYLRLRINPWVRRLLTRLLAIVPTLLVIGIYGEKEVDSLLIFSQVILSLQLGFAVIPLIHFVSNKKEMGPYAIGPVTQFLAWLIAAILIYLNFSMLFGQLSPFFSQQGSGWTKIFLIIAILFFLIILAYITFIPIFGKKKKERSIDLHSQPSLNMPIQKPSYQKIAIALDFGDMDQSLIAHALGQGKPESTYILIHIVESPSSKLLGAESDDYETRKDSVKLELYKQMLTNQGYLIETRLGFNQRAREIVRLVEETGADLLVLGTHGHTGLKDFIFGETVDAVRHEVKIPVLVVNT